MLSSSDPIASAISLVVGIAALIFVMRVKAEQILYRDKVIAEKDAKIASLEQDKKNYADKVEVMLGEIAELNKAVGLNQGIFARPEADARQERTIEDIHKAPSPYDEPATTKKRGRHA